MVAVARRPRGRAQLLAVVLPLLSGAARARATEHLVAVHHSTPGPADVGIRLIALS